MLINLRRPSLIALVDCNNFYASCERVFRPDLEGKAILVLSNNDACVVARSAEVKALGIEMGVPLFNLHDQIKTHGITVFSSSYTLYGDLSQRVMETLKTLTPDVEVYSIDEAFLHLPREQRLTARRVSPDCFLHDVCQIVRQWTGIPVSIGAAVQLLVATNLTPELIDHALKALEVIYRPCYRYKKAGVTLSGLTSAEMVQQSLFDDVEVRSRSQQLMQTLDHLNHSIEPNTLRYAVTGLASNQAVKAQGRSRSVCIVKSPCYTTRWQDLPVIR